MAGGFSQQRPVEQPYQRWVQAARTRGLGRWRRRAEYRFAGGAFKWGGSRLLNYRSLKAPSFCQGILIRPLERSGRSLIIESVGADETRQERAVLVGDDELIIHPATLNPSQTVVFDQRD